MINILHLRDTDRVCGPGKTIIETALAATPGEFHHSVGLLMLARETQNGYQDAALARGVQVIPIRSAHQFDPRILSTIVRIIKEHDIQILHSHEYKSDLLAWAVARWHRIPIMTTIHGWIRNHIKSRLYVRGAQAVLPGFDRVVAVSGETRAAVLACGVPPEKVVLIHNAIVPENYDAALVPRGTIRERYGVPKGARLVGCIGRLSPEKGQRDLLKAAAQIAARHRDVWFLFVGDGPDRSVLVEQAAQLPLASRVIFAGHLGDVRPVYRDIDLLALTSHTEGFPNVVLESFCMGTPVLATDVGGVREIVWDGKTGVLLPPHSPDRIADGLNRLLGDPAWAQRMAAAGQALVLREFTFRQRVAREEAVCSDILHGRVSPAAESRKVPARS